MAEEQELDRLFGLPLDAFVAARDEAVRRLKRNGDPGAAERLGALRKPSVPAWAVNQLARKHPDRLGRLLERGTRQRAAHRAAVAGGGRAGLADAARDERAAVSELVDLAAKELEIAGRTVSDAVRERIAGVLHAAARGEPGADLVRRGRLLRDLDPGGFALLVGPAGPQDVAAGARRPAGHDPARERSAADLRARDEARRRARAAADAAVLARRQAERLRHTADRAEEQASRAREAAQAAVAAERATSEQATRAVAKLAELEASPAE
jgi:hypothetical protein